MQKRAIYVIFFFIIFFTHLFSRDGYRSHKPLVILVEDDYVLYAKRKYLFKYDISTQEIDTIKNKLFSGQILSLSSNESKIYVGGVFYYNDKKSNSDKTRRKYSGLLVFDKASKKWERRNEFDYYSIKKIIANDKYLLMATNKGVIKADLDFKNKTIYDKSDGLEADNAYSLYQLNDSVVFVGTFRYGIGTHEERKKDMFGLGLNKINLKNNKITKINLPKTEKRYYKEFFVIDMYSDLSDKNILKIICGDPWKISSWDFDYKNSIFKKSQNKIHLIKSVLNTFSKDEYSELAGNIVDLLIKLKFERGFPNTIAFETMQLMSFRKDLESINNLLNSSEIIQQEQAVFHTPHIDNPDITELFLEAVKKSDITKVRRMEICRNWWEKLKKI